MVDNPFERRLREKSATGVQALPEMERQQSAAPVNSNPFQQRLQKRETEESNLKSFARYAAQLPLGVLEGTAPALISNLIQFLGQGESLDSEEIEHIRMISQREGVPFDEEKYRQAVQSASEGFPTVSNIARGIENLTGAPLTPKTQGQKLLNLGSMAGKLTPGSIGRKASAGAAAAGATKTAEELGVPEPLAELIGLGGAGATTQIKGGPSISRATKPSGLPLRRFEKLESSREVSSSRLGKINDKLESDFKNATDEIVKSSPIEETRLSLKENPAFKNEVKEQFRKVESLAEQVPDEIHTDLVKRTMVDNALKKKGTGFAPSEYDKEYRKFMAQYLKETPRQNIRASDLVAQYRKNNKALSEAYDPGRSYAFNRGKKDAILEYNRAISDVIDKQYPNTEFSNLFKETNKQWSKIADAEAIDKFIDGIFDGKVRFDKAKRLFDNENYARPFKRGLGEEGFKRFEDVMKDFLTSEKSYKMLKTAQKKGFGDLVSTASAYILHPKLGVLKLAYGTVRDTFKAMVDAMLDKPQLTIAWKRGVDNLKAGKFEQANRDFQYLKDRIPNEMAAATKKAAPSKETSLAGREKPLKLEAPKKQIKNKPRKSSSKLVKDMTDAEINDEFSRINRDNSDRSKYIEEEFTSREYFRKIHPDHPSIKSGKTKTNIPSSEGLTKEKWFEAVKKENPDITEKALKIMAAKRRFKK
jgi:hypothetical protein